MPQPTVLVIRDDDRFSAELRRNGFAVENLQLIRTEPVADPSLLIDKLSRLDRYEGVIMTSPVAAEVFIEHGKVAASTFQGKFYVLGHRAKSVLEGAGLGVEYFDGANTATELIERLGVSKFAGKRLLFVRGNRSMRTIPALLGTVAEIDEVIVYNTVEVVPADEVLDNVRSSLLAERIGWVCFFSPSGIECFVRYFGNRLPDSLRAAAIGTTTADAAKRAGFDVRFVSPKSDSKVFAEALAGFITENEQ
jgi:uroporphyrinogen-III synthase